MREEVRDALLQYEEACQGSGHRLCRGQMTCARGLDAIGEWQREQRAATHFDVGRELLERRGEMPSHQWPTSILLAYVADQLKRQPNLDPLWRATSITTALARLGERGLPADCMVRTCMGPELLRHIILVSANVWCDIAEGSISRAEVPELEGWLQAVDGDPAISGSWTGDRGWVITRSLQGAPRERGEGWMKDAALTHLLAWRLDDYTKTEVGAEDVVLPCGAVGARWIYERFTKTYADDWSEASRSWEAAFRTDPGAVARCTGVPEEVLQERVVTEEQLNRSILRSVTRTSTTARVDGLSVEEVVEIALVQLEEGFHKGARQLADKASRQVPQHGYLRLLRAFSHLPIEPSVSRDVWQRTLALGEVDGDESHILRADIAASHLMEGSFSLAIEEVSKIPRNGTKAKAWLWDPVSLPDEPRVCHSALEVWLGKFDEAVSR